MNANIINSQPLPLEEVLVRKTESYEQVKAARFKGINLLREMSYYANDVSSIGFSATLIASEYCASTSFAIPVVGASFGIIGGTLNIVEGLFIIREALRHIANGDHKDGGLLLLIGLSFLAKGILMILISCAYFGVQVGALANPCVAGAVLAGVLLIAIVCVLQKNISYLRLYSSKQDLASKFMRMDAQQLKEFVDQIKDASQLIEEISGQLEVETALEIGQLLNMAAKDASSDDLETQRKKCQKYAQKYFCTKSMNTGQMVLYILATALGVAGIIPGVPSAAIFATSANASGAVGSCIGLKQDVLDPFARNSRIMVPRAV
jgi:hypothetical protein